jgi:diaminopimelate epimerase
VETGAGTLTVSGAGDGQVRVSMGVPRLMRRDIPMTGPPEDRFLDQPIAEFRGSAVSIGNPHLIVFVDDVSKVDLSHWGPLLEHDPMFPNRINVHFVQVDDRGHLRQRTWERGAGPTLACGTGACAAAVAAYETGRADRDLHIKLPGGELRIEYLDSGEILMTGPAETVFEGEFAFGA